MTTDSTQCIYEKSGRSQWSSQTEALFWQHIGTRVEKYGLWFSLMMREGIVGYLTGAGQLKPGTKVLDYGCGPGHLIEAFLDNGARCFGIENSAETVDQINERFKAHHNWGGAVVHGDSRSVFPDESMDLTTCIETLEHLRDQTLDVLLMDNFRLLRPGGTALFTVPHDEDLDRMTVFCPFCSSEFHQVQHVRSFTAENLSAMLRGAGFEIITCDPTNLALFNKPRKPSPLDWSVRLVGRSVRKTGFRLLDRLFPKPFPNRREYRSLVGQGPHLVAVARRPLGKPHD